MFIKGQSGNPAGRPKDTFNIRPLAKRYTKEALEKLVEWMRSDNPKASVAAALAILDRAYGRPVQAMQFQDTDGLPIGITVSFHGTEDRVPTEAPNTLSS